MELQLEEVIGLFPKQSATELAATLKSDDGEWKSKDEVLAALKNEQKKTLDTVAKGESGKAIRLRMKQAQNYIKENWGIESDSDQIEDHLKLLVETVQGKAGKEKIIEKVVDLDEAAALQHPIVKNLLKSEVAKHSAELQNKLAESEKKFREYLEEGNRKRLDAQLMKWGEKALLDAKADLKKDPTERQKQVRRFVNGLKADYKFKPSENDDEQPIVLGSDGEPLQEGYTDVAYTDLIKRENIFGVNVVDPDKDSAGAKTQHPQQQRLNVPVPATFEAYKEAMSNEKDPAKRKAIMEAYTAAQSK